MTAEAFPLRWLDGWAAGVNIQHHDHSGERHGRFLILRRVVRSVTPRERARLIAPKIRPDVGSASAASSADELMLDVAHAHMIRPGKLQAGN
jgi:hypothetical protein